MSCIGSECRWPLVETNQVCREPIVVEVTWTSKSSQYTQTRGVCERHFEILAKAERNGRITSP